MAAATPAAVRHVTLDLPLADHHVRRQMQLTQGA
jgi:hypothetical protein